MVAVTNRVDELCRLLTELDAEEALQFMEVCQADMQRRTTRYVYLLVSQAMTVLTSWETSGRRRAKALEFLAVLDKYPSQWDETLNQARAILGNDDSDYGQFDDAGRLLKQVLLESHVIVARDWPE